MAEASTEKFISSYIDVKDVEVTNAVSPTEAGLWTDECLKLYEVPRLSKVDITKGHVARFLAILESKVGSNKNTAVASAEGPDLQHIQDMIMSFGTQLAVTSDRKKHIFFDFTEYSTDFKEGTNIEFVSPNVLLYESAKIEEDKMKSERSERQKKYDASSEEEKQKMAQEDKEELNRKKILELAGQYAVYQSSIAGAEIDKLYESHKKVLDNFTEDEWDKYKATLGAWCISHIKCLVKGDVSMAHYYSNKFAGHVLGTYQFNPKTMITLCPNYYSKMASSLRRCFNDTHSALIRLSAALKQLVDIPTEKLTIDAMRSLVTMVMFEHSLAAVSWTQKAANALGVGFIELCEQLRIRDITDDCLKRVIDFHIQYRLDRAMHDKLSPDTKKNHPHIDSFYYKIARLIDPKYFKLIGATNNDYVIGACVQIVMSRNKNDGLQQYNGFRDKTKYEMGHQIGVQYLKNYSERFTKEKILTTKALKGLDLSSILKPVTDSHVGPRLAADTVPTQMTNASASTLLTTL